ncbi:MAG: hypothetical protein ACRDMA_12785 [Solirubrobacterales bacterium]
MSTRTALLGAIAILLIAGFGVGGYLVGEAQAPTDADADQAREIAETEAEEVAEEEAFGRSQERGLEKGQAEGRATGENDGSKAGRLAGKADSSQALAAAEPATPAGPPLEYTAELPHGEPGYLLPEDERTLSCVGIDAETGSCIGD